MVWIACWYGGLEYKIFDENPKMNADKYIQTLQWFNEKIQEREDLSDEWRNTFIMQQDNAPPHKGPFHNRGQKLSSYMCLNSSGCARKHGGGTRKRFMNKILITMSDHESEFRVEKVKAYKSLNFMNRVYGEDRIISMRPERLRSFSESVGRKIIIT